MAPLTGRNKEGKQREAQRQYQRQGQEREQNQTGPRQNQTGPRQNQTGPRQNQTGPRQNRQPTEEEPSQLLSRPQQAQAQGPQMLRMPVMYRTATRTGQEESTVCFICAADHPKYWAIAECGHCVCSICSLRMRLLYANRKCAMCKVESSRVVIIRPSQDIIGKFEDYYSPALPRDEAAAMSFADEQAKEDVLMLTRLSCTVPGCKETQRDFASKQQLKKHVNAAHELNFCEICLAFKKVFPRELSLYTRAELVRHERGESTGTGSGGRKGGHPRCILCNEPFYSEDELETHMREKHELCHICRRNDRTRQNYFTDYAALEVHFRQEHFLCTDPLCLELKFIVFESDLEYKAHLAEVHLAGSGMQRSERRQLGLINTNFSYRNNGGTQSSNGASSPRTNSVASSRPSTTPLQNEQNSSAGPGTPSLPPQACKDFLYGEAVGDLADRMQSLALYEQRNRELFESLRADHHLEEGAIGKIKKTCCAYQKGQLSADETTIKLAALMGHQSLKHVSPTLLDLELDPRKRLFLANAIKSYLHKIVAFPPLPSSAGSASVPNERGKGTKIATSPAPPLLPKVTATKPFSKVIKLHSSGKGSAISAPVDPAKSPLTLLGGGGESLARKSKQPSSFRQVSAASSLVSITTTKPSGATWDEMAFPPLATTSSCPSLAPSISSTSSSSIFAHTANRNQPESFIIGAPEEVEKYESRKESVLEGATSSAKTEEEASSGPKRKGKKSQIIFSYCGPPPP